MSSIIATDDLKTLDWEVQIIDLDPTYADLYIGFTNEEPVVSFNDLQFKYELRQGENIKQYGVYPPPGVRYIRSDQAYLVVERLHLKPENTYELYLWAQNAGKGFEIITPFTTPRPEQPYPSWTWDGEDWIPPIPMPDDGKLYVWDEATLSWIEKEVP